MAPKHRGHLVAWLKKRMRECFSSGCTCGLSNGGWSLFCPSLSFQFLPCTQSSDILHLTYPIFNKKTIILRIRHGYITNNKFGKQALTILSVFTQGCGLITRTTSSRFSPAGAACVLAWEREHITAFSFLLGCLRRPTPLWSWHLHPAIRGCSRQMFDRHSCSCRAVSYQAKTLPLILSTKGKKLVPSDAISLQHKKRSGSLVKLMRTLCGGLMVI